MISSMTGFGRSEMTENTRRVVCEIKSVNHRYLDLTVKTSRRIVSMEPVIRSFLKGKVQRGKLDVYVHYEEAADDTYTIHYNAKLAACYLENMKRLANEFGLENDMTVSRLTSYPDVFELVPEEQDKEELSHFLLGAVEDALQKFLKSRQMEGENLKQDLSDKLAILSGYVHEVEASAPMIIEEYKGRLQKKIGELLEDKQIDESRIAAEVTLFADKICVDEEVVRLKSHVKEMADTLSAEGSVGRKLDFLAQEMNREANTILSKSTDAGVAKLGISMKTLIEKIREQVQNLE